MIGEVAECLFGSHLQHIVDVLSLEGDLQGLFVVPLSPAYLTGYVDVRQEVHPDDAYTVSLAGFTASAFGIEGESSLIIAAQPGFRCIGEDLADIIEYPGIGCGVGPRCSADGILVDLHQLVNIGCIGNPVEPAGLYPLHASDGLLYGFHEDFIDQC